LSRAKEEASMERERADTSLESRGCFVIESERILWKMGEIKVRGRKGQWAAR